MVMCPPVQPVSRRRTCFDGRPCEESNVPVFADNAGQPLDPNYIQASAAQAAALKNYITGRINAMLGK